MEEVRENREQYEKIALLTEYQLIVDSTEQPTARPVDYEERRNTTREKRCTLKISLLFYHSVKTLLTFRRQLGKKEWH